jgi:hypothetical protein
MSLFFRGFHPQGTSGAFAAAAAAARMLDLNAGRFSTRWHRGLPGRRPHGSPGRRDGKALSFRPRRPERRLFGRLAQRDFTGIPDVLEAAYGGYLSCYSDAPTAGG